MRILLQRVTRASVSVSGRVQAEIGRGIVALVGVAQEDDESCAEWLASKIKNVRIFEDETGRMGRSVMDVEGSVLCVSQFTLLGEVKKGARPNFMAAAPSDSAEKLYGHLIDCLREAGVDVETGSFGSTMAVELVNDGPVTLMLERHAP